MQSMNVQILKSLNLKVSFMATYEKKLRKLQRQQFKKLKIGDIYISKLFELPTYNTNDYAGYVEAYLIKEKTDDLVYYKFRRFIDDDIGKDTFSYRDELEDEPMQLVHYEYFFDYIKDRIKL